MGNKCYNFSPAAHRSMDEVIDGFAHGELETDEQKRFEQHLTECKECREAAESLRRLKGLMETTYAYHLDETFNYNVIRNLKKESRVEEIREIRTALEDIIVTVAALIVIAIFGLQLFNQPTVSPFEMSGTLTTVERSSMEQANFSDDQIMQFVLQQPSYLPADQRSK